VKLSEEEHSRKAKKVRTLVQKLYLSWKYSTFF